MGGGWLAGANVDGAGGATGAEALGWTKGSVADFVVAFGGVLAEGIGPAVIVCRGAGSLVQGTSAVASVERVDAGAVVWLTGGDGSGAGDDDPVERQPPAVAANTARARTQVSAAVAMGDTIVAVVVDVNPRNEVHCR